MSAGPIINVQPNPGWEMLGSTKMAANATSSSIVTIPARDIIRITVLVTGYGGGDIVSLRFGGTAGAVDSGNNYATAHGEWNAGQLGNQSTNLESNTQSLLRLAASNVTASRISEVVVSNLTATRKVCSITTATEWGTATTTPRRTTVGHGIWSNTANQIVSVQLVTAGGNTLLAGTGFIVEGYNLA